MEEGFNIISGDISTDAAEDIKLVEQISKERYAKFSKKAHHEWIDEIDNTQLKNAIENIRNNSTIISAIKNNFPSCKVENVNEADEIYWAVSPKDAKGSDRSLVDCHYDSPFAWIPTGGITYYRIIIGMNENNTVETYFPNENKRVKMSTGNFHGLDYNHDWHCVDGKIPEGKYRILLKLHYIITPVNSELYTSTLRSLNVFWAKFSRLMMRISADPKTPFEIFIGFLINLVRKIFNNFWIIFITLILSIYLVVSSKQVFKFFKAMRKTY